MAKSIRSKHRRKMRNVKRQHYGKKELERLKRITANASQLDNIVTMIPVEEMKKKTSSNESSAKDSTTMDVDGTGKVYDPKTKQDEHGHYPSWMNQRAVKRQKQKLAKSKTSKKAGNKVKW